MTFLSGIPRHHLVDDMMTHLTDARVVETIVDRAVALAPDSLAELFFDRTPRRKRELIGAVSEFGEIRAERIGDPRREGYLGIDCGGNFRQGRGPTDRLPLPRPAIADPLQRLLDPVGVIE